MVGIPFSSLLSSNMSIIKNTQANLPNLRRLFVQARTDEEESAYSRNAVSTVTPRLSIFTYI